MIQRIQTIYLLIVVALGITLCFEPILTFESVPQEGIHRAWTLGASGFTETTDLSQTPELVVEPVSLRGVWGLLLATILIPLLALVDIFLYKKRILQARLNIFLALLCLGYFGIMGIYIWFAKMNLGVEGLVWHITPWMAIPVVCFILTVMATRRILRDEALVRAADRLRR